MAQNPTRLAAANIANVQTTYYTVPAGKTAIIKQVALSNTSSAAVTVNLRLAGVYYLFGVTLAANAISILDLSYVLNAGDLVEAFSSSPNAVTLHASGVVSP